MGNCSMVGAGRFRKELDVRAHMEPATCLDYKGRALCMRPQQRQQRRQQRVPALMQPCTPSCTPITQPASWRVLLILVSPFKHSESRKPPISLQQN